MATEYKTLVNVPAVADLEIALQLYYKRNELSTADICVIFKCSSPMARLLKQRGREQMEMDKVPTWNPNYVNTEAAFRSWGLDVTKMQRNLERLRRLNLNTSTGGERQ